MQKATIYDITSNGRLLDKAVLEKKFECIIPWFIYFQFNSLLTRKDIKQALNRKRTEFETLVWNHDRGDKHVLSMIYKLLIQNHSNKPFKYQKIWQDMTQKGISEAEWKQIWASSMFSSNINTLRLQSIKMVSLWYLTPLKLHHIDKIAHCVGDVMKPLETISTAGGTVLKFKPFLN